MAFLESELVGKQFELLRELLRKATVMGLLVNPKSANAETQLTAVPIAKQALGLEIAVQNASTERDLETAFAAFVEECAEQITALMRATGCNRLVTRMQWVGMEHKYVMRTIELLGNKVAPLVDKAFARDELNDIESA